MVNEEKKNAGKEKCFVIMPISDQGDYPAEHFTKVYEQIIKPAIEEAGYKADRADENKICDKIIDQIFQEIQNAPMIVCDLSCKNPNVLYELGLRQAYDKPVVLIQDEKTEKIFDVSGIRTIFYNSSRVYEDVLKAREEIKQAIIATKDGNKASLVKIVKAKRADFSSVQVSDADKTQIILEEIMNKMNEMQRTQCLEDKIRVEQERIDMYSRKIDSRYHTLRTMWFRSKREGCNSEEEINNLLRRIKDFRVEINSYPIRTMDHRRITNRLDELEKEILVYFSQKSQEDDE